MNNPEKNWSNLSFEQLSTLQLYRILQLRAEVFVVEQNCAYLDPDSHDIHPNCRHLFHQNTNGEIDAYCRILSPGIVFNGVAIGRVIVKENSRGNGLGKQLMKTAMTMSQKEWPNHRIEISAQCQWGQFYSTLGFQPLGDQYLEDGIPHQHMVHT